MLFRKIRHWAKYVFQENAFQEKWQLRKNALQGKRALSGKLAVQEQMHFRKVFLTLNPKTLKPKQNTLNLWHAVSPAYERLYILKKPRQPVTP